MLYFFVVLDFELSTQKELRQPENTVPKETKLTGAVQKELTEIRCSKRRFTRPTFELVKETISFRQVNQVEVTKH